MARGIGEKNYASVEEVPQKSKRLIERIWEELCNCLPLLRLRPATSISLSLPPTRDCPDLNDDVVEKILGKLPLPSLLRAKSVCKAWNTAISSPNFNFNAEDERYFVAQADFNNMALFSSALNRWFEIPLPRCMEGFERRTCAAEGAGLYLFVHWNTKLKCYGMIIVNPVTKQQRSLPPLPYRWIQMAAEVVDKSDHIEVIAFGLLHFTEPLSLCAVIYSSVTNEWGSVLCMRYANPFTHSLTRHCWMSAVHNGTVYIVNSSATHLASYDIKSQQFQFRFRPLAMYFPPWHFHHHNMPWLVSCGGKLLLVGLELDRAEIWELDEDNDDTVCSCSLIAVAPHDSIQRSLGTSFEFMVAAASDKIWLTIVGCRNLITFDVRSMKWNKVLPGSPLDPGFCVFPIPRRAVCGTLSIHNKLPFFD